MRSSWQVLLSVWVISACAPDATGVSELQPDGVDVVQAAAAQTDAGVRSVETLPPDAGAEAPFDAGHDCADAGSDAGDALPDAGADAGLLDPTPDAGTDAGVDVGGDAGGFEPSPDAGPGARALSPHLALGLPDTSSVGAPTRWLLVRPQYVISYDTTHKVPNWTSWTLDATWLGAATRATSFHTDPLLPTGTPQARDTDYTNSGFDRGHLCPSADRTITDADNNATFFLTNVVPQTHASNAGPWLDLEDEARRLARAGKQLLIIAGPIYGVTPQAIGSGVSVPLSMFKVLVVTSGDATPASLRATTTMVYAAIIPNTTVVSGPWRQWQVTIDAVEQQTGLDFLSEVPLGVQGELERRLDP